MSGEQRLDRLPALRVGNGVLGPLGAAELDPLRPRESRRGAHADSRDDVRSSR